MIAMKAHEIRTAEVGLRKVRLAEVRKPESRRD